MPHPIHRNFGARANISVEFTALRQNPTLGNTTLSFGGEQVGPQDELCYLDGYIAGGFIEILSKSELDHRYQELGPQDVLESVYQDLDDDSDDIQRYALAHSYLVNFGTLSDYIRILCYREGSGGTIVWQSREPEGSMFSYRFTRDEVHAIIKELKDYMELYSQ